MSIKGVKKNPDIQSSSILLDQGFEVRLCSLGDVVICSYSMCRDTKQGPSDMSNDATCGYDVYCFGKVLLEMVTGELGVADDSSIKNELMNNNPLNFERIIATATADLHGQVGEKVRAMAMIAKGCLNPQPSWRPSMPYVLMALENEVGGMTKPTRRRLQARVNNLA
ncbi:hypothetical protein M9H77_20285 [Catharanthus roseus]|uniref:Uncharacterized protein n=1 Tax=Catharanthus roseus TaxID=4058 RepID=A0ACC0ALS9_CATRO|nr:hypothetical protein M9H77_20285 [Catharanthus roseus]